MVAVVLITVGMTAFLANRAANAEIERLQGQDHTHRNSRLAKILADRYSQQSGWREAQLWLEHASALFAQRMFLADESGTVIWDSHESRTGQRFTEFLGPMLTYPVSKPGSNGNVQLGTLIIDPTPLTSAGVDVQVLSDSSGPSLNLLLILSGLLAVAVALVLTFFLSRRIVAPVESLAKVAQSVAQGDFSVRAEAKSRDEVGELTRTFNSMVAELSRTEMLRRNMVADLAHELRSPVTNIRGYIEGMTDGVIEPSPGSLDSMHDEVLLLTRLINDLQDLALAESGQMRLSMEDCDLAELTRRAAAAVQQQAQAKQVGLRVDAPTELPVFVDPGRVGQVLRNLLSNAVEYTPPGGDVAIIAVASGSQVQVTVKDSGPGIPAEDLPHIFERFYRVDKSRSRATGGVGLGLTIARRLVEAHGGTLQVQSTVGVGTEFIASLPSH